MNLKGLIDILDRIRNSWDKKSGVGLTSALFLVLYYKLIYDLILPSFSGMEWIVKLIFPFLFLVILFIFWLFNTNRFFIQKNKKFVLGLILKIDENETEYKIKRIVKSLTKEINNEFRDVKVKVFPINFKESKSEVEKYLKNRTFLIDAILFASIESGKEKISEKIEEKILIKDFSFIGNFNVHENRQIFHSTVNLANDLSIRHFYKDWAYIEDNSLNDKRKIKFNFRDTILHYSGIYLIYLGEFKLSLEILKTLFDVKLSQLPHPVDGKVKLTKEKIAAGRLNNIILNLFFLTAIKTYWDTNDSKEAYNLLKDCEKIFNRHTDSYYHYIPLARFAYENGNLGEAKDYTNKAKSRKGETVEVLLNLAFFAIIESNIGDMARWYRKIKNKPAKETINLNAADIIEFLERQREKFSEKTDLFDFAVGFLNKLFLDTPSGQKQLLEFIEKNDSNEEFRPLILLANETTHVRNETIIKARTMSKNLNKRKRKKKRK